MPDIAEGSDVWYGWDESLHQADNNTGWVLKEKEVSDPTE